MSDDGPYPRDGEHRGVALYAGQSAERLATAKREIDVVFGMSAVADLLVWAADPRRAPESRLLAQAKLLTMIDEAAAARRAPPVDPARVRALCAGVDSVVWFHPPTWRSDLDQPPVPREATEAER